MTLFQKRKLRRLNLVRKENFQAKNPQNKRAKGIVLSYDGIF